MVMSEIRSLYRDENDLFRTVIKRIWEDWDAEREQWDLRRIEFIFEDPELPLPSDNPAIAVEQRHGWLIPPEWEFISEIWEYERKFPVSETVYDLWSRRCQTGNRQLPLMIRESRRFSVGSMSIQKE